jgi:hypothetical protein
MRTQADDSKKTAMRALRRRHALLAAYLEVLDRLDGPNRRRPPEVRPEQRPRRDIPVYRVPRIGTLSSGLFAHSAKRPRHRGPPIAMFDPLRAQREPADSCKRMEAAWLASTEEQDWFDGEPSPTGFPGEGAATESAEKNTI